MRAANLPTLHTFIANGNQLRIQMAKAISAVEVYRKRGTNEPASAAKLKALFQAGIDAIDASATAVASVSVAPTTSSGAVGSTVQLVPTVLPANATNKAVTYTSATPATATVSASGLVTRIAAGTVAITVRSVADTTKTATATITVT